MSSASITRSEPTATPSPQAYESKGGRGLGGTVSLVKRKVLTREGWFGDYDYAWLCLPTLPFMNKTRRPPPFYALDAELPLAVAITSGLQHALAMLAGNYHSERVLRDVAYSVT